MKKWMIIWLILAALLVVFAIQNAGPVDVDLWFWEIRSSLALLIFLVFAIGVVTGLLYSAWTAHKKRIKEKAKAKAKLSQNEGIGKQ